MNFNKWLDVFLEEKQIQNQFFDVEYEGLVHIVEQEILTSFIKTMPKEIKKQVQKTFVMIDFKNGDVKHYLNHLANGYVRATFN